LAERRKPLPTSKEGKLPFSNSNTCYGICTTSIGLSHADSIQTKLRDGSDYFKPDHLNTNYFNTIGASIAPVSQRLALAPDRFYLWLTIDFERLAIPIQLTKRESDRESVLRIVERVLPATIGGAS